MIDMHCHYDMINNPEEYIHSNENKGIITLGMTNLPSHYKYGVPHLKGLRNIKLALGLHPLLIDRHIREYPLFVEMEPSADYIGEVGLDFSNDGIRFKNEQINSFKFVLRQIRGKEKIVSVHSRKAEYDVLRLLMEYNIANVIFHWYSGDVYLINDIVKAGYYFSINESMTLTKNGEKVISKIPKEKILTETDAPYNHFCSICNTVRYIAKIHGVSIDAMDKQIYSNYRRLFGVVNKSGMNFQD